MTCSEVREILFAFLDNELDAALSIEVQRHVEHCPLCAREMEIERNVGKRLAAALDRGAGEVPVVDDPVRLPETVYSDDSAARPAVRAVWTRIGFAVAAAAVLAIVTWFFVAPGRLAEDHPALARLLVQDFDHFISEGRPLQVASADRAEVTDWLRDRTGLSVSLPATGGRCKLIGGRKCKLNGRPAAFACYEMNGAAASLVALAGTPEDVRGMERVASDGRTYWQDRCGGHSVVAVERDGLIYAAVSRSDLDGLKHLLAELD